MKLLAGTLCALAFAAPLPVAAVTITSLTYAHVGATPDCQDTVAGTTCTPVGITEAYVPDPPFLNDLNTKEVNLKWGFYRTYGNPWPATNFMIEGESLRAILTLSNGVTLQADTIVPNLSVQGMTLFSFLATDGYTISITTTGITNANRMSFGNAPAAFAPDAYADYVLQLEFVPEPATWALMLLGFGGMGAMLRRRRTQLI